MLAPQLHLELDDYRPRITFGKAPHRHELLTTLSRYEVTLQRNMHRAHDALRELQARRTGHEKEAPRLIEMKPVTRSKYPPAKPGALV